MGSNSSSLSSNEEMLASIDPEKMHNMSLKKRIAAQVALDCRLTRAMYSRGRIRSKFQGISYSDCKNLLVYVCTISKFPDPVALNPYLKELIEELQSMVEEFESYPQAITTKQTNSDQVLESNGIGIGNDNIPFPVPIPCAKQIANGSCLNSGEQHLRGLINNQTGNVSGNGNGSYIVTVMNDCKLSWTKGNQMAG